MRDEVSDSDVGKTPRPSCLETATPLSCPLLEACLAQQERDWLAGKRVLAAEIVSANPALEANPAWAAELVYAEYILRRRVGEPVTWETHAAQFPQYAEQLRALRQADLLLGESLEPQGLIGSRLGDFEIQEEIGRGGNGIVYRAVQLSLGRTVAVKVLRYGEFSNAAELVRFQKEAATVSQLNHPNIVQVFVPGESAGRPYLVYEYVSGPSLSKFIEGSPLSYRLAGSVVATIADAIQHAHDHGVIHRDLKPANVLLAGMPEHGRIKVTDFGASKQISGLNSQPLSCVIGTPSYMAPEQLGADEGLLTRQTDVYGLGTILYECLTGLAPFRGKTVAEVFRQIREEDPLAPTRLNPSVPRDLETICLKCLAKDPEQRYASASALAEDLRRFLAGRPIIARPTPLWRRCGKWCRRHPAWTTLIAVVAVSAVSLTSLSIWYNGRIAKQLQIAEDARATAQTQQQEMRRRAYVSDMALASRAWNSGNVSQMLSLLDRNRPQRGETDLRDFSWEYLRRQYEEPSKVLGRHQGKAIAAAMSLNGTWGASAGDDGIIRLWSLPAGDSQAKFQNPSGIPIYSLAFSPDGQQLASAGSDGVIRIWEIPSGRLLFECSEHRGHINDVVYSPDGRLLTSGGADHLIRLWDPSTGRLQKTFQGHTGVIERLAFHPDGNMLASTSKDATLRLWDISQSLADARLPEGVLFKAPVRWPRTIAFSPDGRRLMVGTSNAMLLQFNVETEGFGEPVPLAPEIANPSESIRAICWPRQDMLALGTLSIHVSNLSQDLHVEELKGHRDSVLGLAGSRDRTQLLSTSADGEVRLWTLSPSRNRLVTYEYEAGRVAWSNAGFDLATMNDRILFTHNGQYSFDLNTGESRRSIKLWPEAIVPFHSKLSHQGQWLFQYIDGNRLACRFAETGAGCWICDLPSRNVTQKHWIASDPTEEWVAVPCESEAILIRRDRGEIAARFPHPDRVGEVAFWTRSDRTLMLVTACHDGQIRIWDVAQGILSRQFRAHSREVIAIAISADQQLMASGGNDRAVRVWRLADLSPIAEISRRDAILKLGFFSSNNYLVCGDATISLWNFSDSTEVMQFPREYHPLAFAISPNGKLLALARSAQIEILRDEPIPDVSP